jgi:hypothetical protein
MLEEYKDDFMSEQTGNPFQDFDFTDPVTPA